MWSCLRRKISSKALTLTSSSSWSSVSITIEIYNMLIVTPVSSQLINYIIFRDKINISGSNLQLKFERFFSVLVCS